MDYKCKLGRQLWDGTTHLPTHTVQCQWNATWEQDTALPCQWVQCIDPPARQNMTNDYATRGKPYEFNETAVYTCRNGFFFYHDRYSV